MYMVYDTGYLRVRIRQPLQGQLTCTILKMDFRSESKYTYSSVLYSHTVLIKLFPCRRYRQLNSVLNSNNHILKSSKRS